MLAPQHKEPSLPATTASKQNPQGKTKCGTHGHPICAGPGVKHQTHICTKYGIRTYFKGSRTLKQLLVQPKDNDPKEKKSGVIDHYQCPTINCRDEYIGETSRTLGEQCKEHLREPSPIQVHKQLTGHQTTLHNFNILGREG